jgi:hypothetical protein
LLVDRFVSLGVVQESLRLVDASIGQLQTMESQLMMLGKCGEKLSVSSADVGMAGLRERKPPRFDGRQHRRFLRWKLLRNPPLRGGSGRLSNRIARIPSIQAVSDAALPELRLDEHGVQPAPPSGRGTTAAKPATTPSRSAAKTPPPTICSVDRAIPSGCARRATDGNVFNH